MEVAGRHVVHKKDPTTRCPQGDFAMPKTKELPKVLFAKIGWMLRYRGISDSDQLCSRMKYPMEHKRGWEVFNFAGYEGVLYGDVIANRGGIPRLKRIDPSCTSKVLRNILVVFVASWPHRYDKKQRDAYHLAEKEAGTLARRMSGQQVVVGWYPVATLQGDRYRRSPDPRAKGIKYLCTERASRGVLLPAELRSWRVPGGCSPGAADTRVPGGKA
jgi:hypothetical protein